MFDKLGATEDQLDFPVIYASALNGYAGTTDNVEELKKIGNMRAIFDAVIKYVPVRDDNPDGPLMLQICSLDYSTYVGKIGVGRVHRGRIYPNSEVAIMDGPDGTPRRAKINQILEFEGLERKEVNEAQAGDIILVTGIEELNIGTTITDKDHPEALPMLTVDEPTLTMNFQVNTSPLAGREGKFVTSRQIRERLERELKSNVAMRMRPTADETVWEIAGRGELHLTILLENMRREGYEFQVSTPQVLFQQENGKTLEPMEQLVVDVPDFATGSVMEKMGTRKGSLVSMNPFNGRTKLEFIVPARGLFGYRNEFLTDTKGEGIMSSVFYGYEPYKGDIPKRATGSLVAFETGTAVTYGLYNAQERGTLFIGAGVEVYEGMIVGQSPKDEDIVVNVCKKKHMTNTRASGSDDALRLIPPKVMSLEQAIEFIAEDELIEVTPKNIRMRKRILDKSERMKAWSKNKGQ